MPLRTSSAEWKGTLRAGSGTLRVGTGLWEGAYSFGSRFEDEPGTNPEELLAAAHAACFSMALSGLLEDSGYQPRSIRTTASVSLNKTEGAYRIREVRLVTEADVAEIDDETFLKLAEQARANCPVSVALCGVAISVEASLSEVAHA